MRTPQLLVLIAVLFLPAVARACPTLAPYYPIPGQTADWQSVDRALAPLLSECLLSSEYFALRGAAQLNTGQLTDALESLERALLLEPENGAAQIDYALALFESGQLFAALEVNERLIERNDLPPGLAPAIRQRQSNWRDLTRDGEVQLDLLLGYDNNLNAAPADEQLTLTLSGESILLTLNPEFQPVSGPYVNFRSAGRYRFLAPNHQHNFSASVRGRVSEDTKSDLLQFSARYNLLRPDQNNAWQLQTGVNQLFYGGSSLFTGSDLGLRYQPPGDEQCRPDFLAAVQFQHFHGQAQLDAVETKLSAGGLCDFPAMFNAEGRQRVSFGLSLLRNDNLDGNRLGGDRRGWQLNFDWQQPLGDGAIYAQLNHTRQRDGQPYSALLSNNSIRRQNRSYMLLQYRKPAHFFGENSTLMINLYHQYQQSNIDLFKIVDTTIEAGLSFRF